MKSLNLVTSLVISAAVFFTACSKSDSSTSKTKTELITQGSWKFSGATVNGVDVSSLLQTCQKDNVLTFSSNGSGTLDEGATKCNSSDPQTDPFTWSFMTNETVLHVSQVFFTGGSSDFTIVTLSDSQLVLSQPITISSTTQTATVTFTH